MGAVADLNPSQVLLLMLPKCLGAPLTADKGPLLLLLLLLLLILLLLLLLLHLLLLLLLLLLLPRLFI